MSKHIKVNLSYLRVLRGRVSQKAIADATGIAQKTISALESGSTRGIDFNTLAKLCDYLKCSPNDLLLVEEDVDTTPVPEDVLKKADDLIARALNKAMDAPAQTPEQVWARFDALRARMAGTAARRNAEQSSDQADRRA